ncbi:carboxypeptidase regulatory-like domain-containing protein [Arsenicibacter rosenii]|uniref:TonB-dependent receptor plug domain-containing protein n=1 Tax=Arsenicibacter rosenii TaxID=1750698 RepID=A0A1S2VFP3_9BACT|nr:carboxypeptidase-like regulatory domain-containing protein [Arsenicibacter rosenii]OIN57571.1 hypothetical protein BLX24_18980 [Arsenicibacter rosenii]
MKPLLSFIFLLFFCLPDSMAQSGTPTTVLTGKVVDEATGNPLPFANVFINNTTRGTSTDENGNYRLANVPIGTIEIVASFVGYTTIRQYLRLEDRPAYSVQIKLKADASQLTGVTVSAKRSKFWERRFRLFREALLGDSPFQSQCAIINSGVVQLSEEEGHLKAKASEPLIIENRALGYRIFYDLAYFDLYQMATFYAGTARFEELKAANPDQTERWQRHRKQAYDGSTRHLMASMIAGTAEREGFMIYQSSINVPSIASSQILLNDNHFRSKPVKTDTLFRQGELAFERIMTTTKPLEIFYTHRFSKTSPYRDMPYAYSLMMLPKGTCEVNVDGTITQAQGMEIRGHLGNDRLANMLPADWYPPVKGASLAAQIPSAGTILKADKRLDSLSRAWEQQHTRQTPAVFLHTDKALYATGDRLWFSAFYLHASSLQLIPNTFSDLDPSIHVALLGPDGQIVRHEWVALRDGRGSGDFFLPDTLRTGLYHLYAYTEGQRVDSLPAFQRTLSVYNFFPAAQTSATPASSVNPVKPAGNSLPLTDRRAIDIQFLPEGGRWVSGLTSRLAIRAVDRHGRGIVVRGRVQVMPAGDAVRFETGSHGLGLLTLTPADSQTYVAHWQTESDSGMITLRQPDPAGLTLKADVTTDSSRLAIYIRGSAAYARQIIYLTIQSRGQLLQQNKIQLEEGKANLDLLVAKLPPGLCQITLFDAHARPWAERLVFIPEHLPPVQVSMQMDQTRYQPRQQARLTMTLTDGGGFPLNANLSTAIADADQLPPDTLTADIYTHLLLTGELQRPMTGLTTFLRSNAHTGRVTLDQALMTFGWRRINWQQTQPAVTEAADTLGGIVISGRVLDKKGKPVPNAEVMFTSRASGRPFSRSVGADNQGYFRLGGLMITDTLKLMAQAFDYKLQAIKATILFDKPAASVPVDRQTHFVNDSTLVDWAALSSALRAARARQEATPQFYRQRNAKLLGEVTVRAEKPRDVERQRTSSLGTPDYSITIDERLSQYPNVYEMMMGRVPGVQVSRLSQSASGYTVVIRGIGTLTGSVQPLYILDGVYLTENEEGSILLSLDPNSIERIDIIKNAGVAAYGARGANGVIIFYTKKGPAKTKPASADLVATDLTVIGFPTVREFYIPAFEAMPDGTKPVDRRDIIFWKPVLQTDAQGQVKLDFPISDVVRYLRVSVQGITTYGRPISVEQLIRVQ